MPEAQHDADLRSFRAAHAALEAAADALEAEEAASKGGGAAAPGAEERRLLAAAQCVTATWATATWPLHHPRLASVHHLPAAIETLLWDTVAQPVISFNILFWERGSAAAALYRPAQ